MRQVPEPPSHQFFGRGRVLEDVTFDEVAFPPKDDLIGAPVEVRESGEPEQTGFGEAEAVAVGEAFIVSATADDVAEQLLAVLASTIVTE